MNTPELKNCPFCNADAEVRFNGVHHMVVCKNYDCIARTNWLNTPEDAISAWNRRASQPSPAPDGWVLVPREPTPEMCDAAINALSDATISDPKASAWDAIRAYRAMISAAPAAPAEARDE